MEIPKQTRVVVTLILIGLLLMGGGLLSAQSETPTPDPLQPTPTVRPLDLACDVDALLQQQATLTAQLGSFDQDAGANPGLALETLFKTGAAYQELALACGYIPADAATRAVGSDVERILTTLAEIDGDPLNGQLIYNGEYGCASCHEGANRVAPSTEGTLTRIEETRLNDPALEGYTVAQYLIESIVQPGHYVAPGYQNIMSNNFGERLTAQELADMLLFLESQDQFIAVENPTNTELTGELPAAAEQIVDGLTGDVVILTLESDTFDPVLTILAADGSTLGTNDDFGGTKNARLGPLVLPADEAYTLQIGSYEQPASGAYTLNIATYSGCGPEPVAIVNTTTQSVNLHDSPNLSSIVTGSVINDECFSLVGESANGEWLLAQTLSGQAGWIAASLVEIAGDVNTLPVLSN
ncbi:MAG: SH3 domain-containing protein [Anaerolineae bacterium]|nr:SH3 domain-containing protein [Anaerolineae bacterium]